MSHRTQVLHLKTGPVQVIIIILGLMCTVAVAVQSLRRGMSWGRKESRRPRTCWVCQDHSRAHCGGSGQHSDIPAWLRAGQPSPAGIPEPARLWRHWGTVEHKDQALPPQSLTKSAQSQTTPHAQWNPLQG